MAKRYLDELALLGETVELAARLRPTLSDPDDEMVLETGINGHANAIVTFNEGMKEILGGLLGVFAVRCCGLSRPFAS